MPSWSPDGREIAFFSDRDGDWGVYTVAAIGGNPRNVLSLPGIGRPQLERAAVVEGRNQAPRVGASGRRERRDRPVSPIAWRPPAWCCPKHEGNVCWDLSVAPDGRRFAYVEGGAGCTGGDSPLDDSGLGRRGRSAHGRAHQCLESHLVKRWKQGLLRLEPRREHGSLATGGGGRRNGPSGSRSRSPRDSAFVPRRFLPMAASLAYSRGGRVSNVWRVPILSDRPATWADAKQLTSEHAYIEFVDVSPDGTLLAVSSDRRGNQDLWLLPAAGGEMTPLTTDPTPDWNPRWSPDGREIAFYAYRSGNRDIWVMPSRGGPARQLTSHPASGRDPERGRPMATRSRSNHTGSGRSRSGSWMRKEASRVVSRRRRRQSPNGHPTDTWLVVGEARTGSIGSRKTAASPCSSPHRRARYSPRFSRDGQSIYYSVITGPRENHDFWKLSLDDGKVSRLTKLEGRRGNIGDVFATDGRYLYFTWREDDGDIWVMDVVKDVRE